MTDISGFVQYYNRYRDRIFTYILYRVAFDRSLAEDLTSEIFLKAYEHFNSYDPSRPFQAWIYRIAHNHLISHLKKQKPVYSLEDAHILPSSEHLPAAVEEKLMMGDVMETVHTLPEMQQTVLLLRYQHGLSHEEIGEITNKNPGAVRAMLSRATAYIREKLQSKYSYESL